MKTFIIIISVMGATFFAPQRGSAQGTTVSDISTLDRPRGAIAPISGYNWWWVGFKLGNNPEGYKVDSVQLSMSDAWGNPAGFDVSIYSATSSNNGRDFFPAARIGGLSGLDPVTAGIYTYLPTETITLLPSTAYFIVLSSGAPQAQGCFNWNHSHPTGFLKKKLEHLA